MAIPAPTPGVTRTGPEAAVAGSPAALRLVREIVAAPERARRVDVVGAGGHGKTALLDAVATALRGHGVAVRTDIPGALDEAEALIVDDAQLLGPDALERLARLAAGSGGWLVVAHRPWPRPPGLAALGAVLAARHAPVVLAPLDRAGVAERAAHLRVPRPAEPVLAAVHSQTAGVPALVDRLLPEIDATTPHTVPSGLLAQLDYAVAALDGRVAELLLLLSAGAPLDPELLVPMLRCGSVAALDELVEAGRAAGHLTADGRVVPIVAAAVLARTPPATRTTIRRDVAEHELRRGGDVVAAARGLLGSGAGGAATAEVFLAAGDEVLLAGGADADVLLAAAVAAGVPPLLVAARRAHAGMLRPDTDHALAQADLVLAAPDRVPSADLVLAGSVAAAVLARRGMLARSAELYRWLGAAQGDAGQMGRDAVLAVPALIGTGALDEAEAVLAPAANRPPTLIAGAEELMARGLLDSVTGTPTAALSQLTRASALVEGSPRAALLPDTPAALAALVAVHCGELDVAQSVLERALRVRSGGPAAVVRHRLLLGWIALARGATSVARALLAQAAPPGRPLEPRDELLAAALDVALVRRTGDLAALMPAWGRAREAIVRHPVDLFVLHPLGELAVAATRLRESSWVRPHLDEAHALLHRLGDPALWAAPLHWAGLQAAIVDEARAEGARHVAALRAAAGGSRYAAAMATAAPLWLRLLDADIDAEAVEAAARGLHAAGLAWEGGKLAGQAAIRTRDRRAMTTLLQTARALQSTAPLRTPGEPADEPTTPPSGSPVVERHDPAPAAEEPGDGPLSEREREVAALVLDGLTYKQVGEQLFISAKTVEHHVARMRQRLGSSDRGDLFARLRQIVGD